MNLTELSPPHYGEGRGEGLNLYGKNNKRGGEPNASAAEDESTSGCDGKDREEFWQRCHHEDGR